MMMQIMHKVDDGVVEDAAIMESKQGQPSQLCGVQQRLADLRASQPIIPVVQLPIAHRQHRQHRHK